MTVRCPQCDTLYRIPPRSRLDTHPTFRCSRCEHVFDPERGRRGAAARRRSTRRPRRSSDTEPMEDDVPDDARPETTISTARFACGRRRRHARLRAPLDLPLHSPRTRHRPGRRPSRDRTERRGRPASIPRDIQLTDVHGQYLRVQGDRLVFVITGTAVNNAPVPVSAIQIEGRVTGAGEQRRLVFAGAAPHSVEDLSEQRDRAPPDAGAAPGLAVAPRRGRRLPRRLPESAELAARVLDAGGGCAQENATRDFVSGRHGERESSPIDGADVVPRAAKPPRQTSRSAGRR